MSMERETGGVARLALDNTARKDKRGALATVFSAIGGGIASGARTGKNFLTRHGTALTLASALVGGGGSGYWYFDDGIPKQVKNAAYEAASKELYKGIYQFAAPKTDGNGMPAMADVFFNCCRKVNDGDVFNSEVTAYPNGGVRVYVVGGTYGGTVVTIDPSKGPRGTMTITRTAEYKEKDVYGYTYGYMKPLADEAQIHAVFDLDTMASMDMKPSLGSTSINESIETTDSADKSYTLLRVEARPNDMQFRILVYKSTAEIQFNLVSGQFWIGNPCLGVATEKCTLAAAGKDKKAADKKIVSGMVPGLNVLQRAAVQGQQQKPEMPQ